MHRKTFFMISMAVCLILSSLPTGWIAPQPAQAQDGLDCWVLVDVITEWKHFADGDLVPFTPSGLSYSVAAEDLWHFVEYNNPNNPQGHVYARASWTAPPQRFCEDDTLIYQYQVDNFAVSDNTNTLAIITYGPDPIHSSNGFGQTRIGYNEGSSYEQEESLMLHGQMTLDEPYTWRAEADIGDLIAIIRYRYLPDTQPPPAATPVPAATSPAQSGVPNPAGEILFTTNNGSGDGDIWVMNADGANKRVILDSSVWDVNPTWSPDGAQISFISNRSMVSFDIYTMNADGSNQTMVADQRFHDVHPIWSPVNNQIIFHAKQDGGVPGLFITENGSTRTLLDSPSSEYFADWSPDGTQIVFSSNSDGDSDIYVIRADGSDLRQLTNIGGAIWPRWSPDGRRMAFHRSADGNTDIYVMNADGTGIQQLTTAPSSDAKPVWSPDSAFIAFSSDRTGNGDIYVVNLSGVVVGQLTDSPLQEEANDWRIDGPIQSAAGGDPGVEPAFAALDMASVMAQIPPPISPSRIEQVGDNGSGLPAFISYAFEPEEVAPGVLMDMVYGWALGADTAQQNLRWDFHNESGDATSTVEYIADIPKSFAATVADIAFSVPPTQIINDDPIVKWIIDFSKAIDRRIDARSLNMIALADWGEFIGITEQFQQQLVEINLRRRMAACQFAISDTPVEKSLCVLTVIAQSPQMFTANICETFGDVTGSGNNAESIAFRHACRDIFAQYNNFHCNSLADEPDMQATCLHISRMVYNESCTGLTGIDYDMCLYDVAAYTGQADGCNSIANQDLALDCRASLTDNPALCRQINDPARHSACCAIFEDNAKQYALCMEGVGEDVIDGEPVDDMGDDQGDTQTLGEVLGSDDPPPPDNTSSAAFGPLPTAPDLSYLMNESFYADYRCEGYDDTLRVAWNGSNFTYGQPGIEEVMGIPNGTLGVVPSLDDHDDYIMATAFTLGAPNLWLPLDGNVYTIPAWVHQDTADQYVGFVETYSELRLQPSPDTQTVLGTSLPTTLYQGTFTREYINDDREGNAFAVGYAHHVLDHNFRAWFDTRTGLLVRSETTREATLCEEEGDHIELCPIAPTSMRCELVGTSLPIAGQ